MKNNIGDYFKELRSDLDLTLEELSNMIGLSKSYINQIEKNERTPSKKKLIEILFYFNEYQELEPPLPVDEIFTLFANQKKLDYDLLVEEYRGYVNDFKSEIEKKNEKFNARIENIVSNRIEYPTDHDKKLRELDKPYYDLEWLLSQKDFHLFYGRDFHTDNKQIHTDSLDAFTYSKLSEEDKKMIKSIIEAIFSNKYKKYNPNKN